MSTFVSVGNATQPFSRLLDEVARIVSILPTPVTVQHGVTPFACADCRAVPFLQMNDFEDLIASSELLILHAGAGSVIHAIRAGKIPVVMPRQSMMGELVDNHQMEFAKELEALGRVVVAEEALQLVSAVQIARARQREGSMKSTIPHMLKFLEKTLNAYAKHYD